MLLSAVSLMAKVDSCKGPYMMTQNVSVPSGCSKVIVDSSSSIRFNNGQKLYVGAKITINGTGYLSFEP